MARPFPTRFSPDPLTGPRAAQLRSREDAFQQLVGDWVRVACPGAGWMGPTRGQDGAIDGFVSAGGGEHPPFDVLPGPIVVECKDHDDTLSGVRRNVLQGWASVEEALVRAADGGWPDAYAPWRDARSYLYCVSAVLPTQQLRQELTSKIEAFFAGLPVESRPPIEDVRVLDWSDLRHWLSDFPRLADGWIGTGLDRILGHEEYVARLTGFLEMLSGSVLSFVPPPEESSFHPDRVLEKLAELRGRGGVLLVGAGGVGKTRTSLEVAVRAHAAGWRVLHVSPGEPQVTADDLAQAVGSVPGPVLLVIDYLDQMRGLDLGVVRRTLLPQAAAAGVDLALLANSRPGWVGSQNPAALQPLEPVLLQPTSEQRRSITDTMLGVAAPTAIAVLGREAVARACGDRPIVALFVARELESRAQAGELRAVDAETLRRGDLLHWLRRRLDEDRLTVPPSATPLLPGEPDPVVIAAAVALASAPQPAEDLAAAAAATLADLAPALVTKAAFVVEALHGLGWLERRGGSSAAAHDVVADEVLERVLLDGSGPRENLVGAALMGSAQRARSLGRMAASLERLVGSLPAEEHAASLAAAVDRSLKEAATRLGEVLARAEPDEGGYALGSLLAGGVSRTAVVHEWSNLVEPWLRIHGTRPEARHLLYAGLRSIAGEGGAPLLGHALRWLEDNGTSLVATFVLSPLLEREDLTGRQGQEAIGRALTWLSDDARGHSPEAQFVLHSLLDRADLSQEAAREAIEDALAWLSNDERRLSPEAQFVLHRLLGRSDLSEEAARETIGRSLAWLADRARGLSPGAGFVLPPLLGRSDLSEAAAREAIGCALAWVSNDARGLSPEAQFVLHRLLGRADLSEEAAREAIRRSLAWLADGARGLSPDAGFVLHPLLGRSDLSEEAAREAIRRALAWLSDDARGHSPEAGFVLHPLLGRSDLSEEAAREAIRRSLAWLSDDLREHLPEAQFVLSALLRRSDLPDKEQRRAVCASFAWLEHQGNRTSVEAGFVLQPLITGEGLDPEQVSRSIRLSECWLRVHHETRDAEFVLGALLARQDLDPAIRNAVQEWSLARLSRIFEQTDGGEASFLLHAMLSQWIIEDDAEEQLLELAFRWLDQFGAHPDADYVFKPLLRWPGIDAAEWRAAASVALEWLAKTPIGRDTPYHVDALLLRPRLLTQEQLRFTVEKGLNWAIRYPKRSEASRLLGRIRNASRRAEFAQEIDEIVAVLLRGADLLAIPPPVPGPPR
jgi:hypothetical protein